MADTWEEIRGVSNGKVLNPDHLGDGAYIGTMEYGYVIFTYNGIFAENVVYLEPLVMDALERQVARLKAINLERRKVT
jgi:hypothetical protein